VEGAPLGEGELPASVEFEERSFYHLDTYVDVILVMSDVLDLEFDSSLQAIPVAQWEIPDVRIIRQKQFDDCLDAAWIGLLDDPGAFHRQSHIIDDLDATRRRHVIYTRLMIGRRMNQRSVQNIEDCR
jgi:hypothetical protein